MHPRPRADLLPLALLAACLGSFPSPAGAVTPWPGETWTAATNLTSLNPTAWASNLSGAYWNPATRRLWVCTNGPAKFWSLRENGTGGFVIEREYTGVGDLEAICQTSSASDRVFLLDEQARTIRSYRVSDGVALTTWFLSTIPDWGNLGPEGIAFVPNAWLALNGFVDGTGAPYPQSVHGANGFGGIVFIAVQTSGWVYAFDLRTDGTFTFVGRYLTSRSESCEMTFDDSIGKMYVLHNIDGNLLEITSLASTVSGADRRLVSGAEVQVPSGSNIEGFGLTPALGPGNAVGGQWGFFTDDSNLQGALRWFQQLPSKLEKHAGDGQTAPANTPVAIAPAVRVSDAFANRLPGVAATFAVSSGGGSITQGNATTDVNGVATVGSWTLGPIPGPNSLEASGAGLGGSPLTFTATGEDPLVAVEPFERDGVGLAPPSPHPGHGSLRFSFTLPGETPLTVAVFDARGRRIRTLAAGTFQRGVHRLVWDGLDDQGAAASTGIYFYRLSLPDRVLARRGLLLR
jgi:hypothetical protein